MGFSFLAPLFLVGLAALAVPILIHLTQRVRREAIAFPSLMFLRKVPYRTVRRQRIRHWLLFLLRAAAVVLLVSAFARPLLDSASLVTTTLGAAREVVILVDRSYSMGYSDRWSRALAAARGVVDGLGSGDRVTVVWFSDQAEAANRPTGDRAALMAVLDRGRLGGGRTRYTPALQLARDLLEASELPRRQVVLITDFQRIGWDPQQGLRLPAGTQVTKVDLSDPDASNVVVAGVLLQESDEAGPRRLRVSARLVNAGAGALVAVPVQLEIDGQLVQKRSIDLPAGAAAVVRFAPVPALGRTARARVVAPGDRLAVDDAFHFVLAPETPLEILVVQHPAARTEELLYLREALSIGRSPPFEVGIKRATQLTPGDFDARDVVILNDAPFPEGVSGRRLDGFVRDGGGLLIVLGRRSPDAVSSRQRESGFAGITGPVVDRLADRGATVSILDYSHPVFAPFRAPHSGDFSAARFFRYRRFESPAETAVLARFDDGSAALTDLRVGEGRVMVWASGIDNLWSDLPVQPVFLPFVHQIVRYLADYRKRAAWRTVGEVVDLRAEVEGLAKDSEVVIESPRGKRFVQPLAESPHLELREHGFYEIRPLAGGGEVATVVAVNPDVAESDLTAIDSEELLAAIAPAGADADWGRQLAAALTPAEKERRQGLWWYLLAGVLLILLAETAVAQRTPGTVR